jgi:endonuclease/exonuclease/phosphatase family metal-dependent hydrolase
MSSQAIKAKNIFQETDFHSYSENTQERHQQLPRYLKEILVSPSRLESLWEKTSFQSLAPLAALKECSFSELYQSLRHTVIGRWLGHHMLNLNMRLESRVNICDLSRHAASSADISPISNVRELANFLRFAQSLDAINYLKELFEHQLCPEVSSLGSRICDTLYSPLEVSISTYNVWGLPTFFGYGSKNSRRFAQIGTALGSAGADIVGLQEMWHEESNAILAQSKYPYFSAKGNNSLRRGGSGLVTLSKFPIVYEEFFPFSETAGVERWVQKGALLTRIQHPSGVMIDCYNVHCISEPEKINTLFVSKSGADEIRLTQIEELASWISRRQVHHIPVLVIGDFNLDETAPSYSTMIASLGEDLFRRRFSLNLDTDRERRGYTFDPLYNDLSKSPLGKQERIDYVLLRNTSAQGALISGKRIFTEKALSDHYGVEIKLKLYNQV